MAARLDKRAWLALPAVLLSAAVFLYPAAWLLLRSFSEPVWGWQNYAAALGHPVYLRVFWNTVVISASVTALTLLIGYPVAYTMAHASERLRRLLLFVVLVPFWTSLLVRTYAWMVLLQRTGLVNASLLWLGVIEQPLELIHNRIGVLVGMVQVQLPFMILPLYAVLSRIDERLTQAAATLGARPMRNFLRIYLPLSREGVLTGSALVFIISLGYYITPALLGGPQDAMIAQLILGQIENFGNWGVAGALSVVLLVGTAVTVGLVWRVLGGRTAPAR
jgi:putative spermidine/putrescine transport system permease protein